MLISLITVCYNSEKTIRATLESVLRQTYTDYEYIIIDGKSEDNTVSIVNQYKPHFEKMGVHLICISEKDKGLYDAMNKGINLASGDIIGIINSDDVLSDENAFAKIIQRFQVDDCDATYSDLYIMDAETLSSPNRIFIAGRKSYKLGWYPPHPTLYLKREVYEKYGKYNIKYKIAADYDFMLRIMKKNIKMSYIRSVLVYMRAGGTSTYSLKAYKRSFDEAIDVLKSNHIRMPYMVNIIRTLVIFKQRLLGVVLSAAEKKRLL